MKCFILFLDFLTQFYKICNRAFEKVDKEQLNRKRFETYQTISCFGAFLLTLPLNNITKLAAKSINLSKLFQIIIESIFIKFKSTLLKNILTNPSSSSLTYFRVQLFPDSETFLGF